jgi:hypothetical protein
MSQEIGHVTLSHGMSLVITLSRDCPTPLVDQSLVVNFEKMAIVLVNCWLAITYCRLWNRDGGVPMNHTAVWSDD